MRVESSNWVNAFLSMIVGSDVFVEVKSGDAIPFGLRRTIVLLKDCD